MAITKGSYYSNEGPQIPAAGGDYGAPNAHAATANRPTVPGALRQHCGIGGIRRN